MTETGPGQLITAVEAADRRQAARDPGPPAIAAGDTGPAALMDILRRNPNLDPATLREFLAIKTEWEDRENRKAYIAALSRAQATMPVVDKNKHVFFEGREGKSDTDYRHADYGHLVETIKPHLAAQGLSYEHNVIQAEGQITVECILRHEFGHDEKVVMFAPPEGSPGMNAIQKIKSTVTYLKRATFEAITGAATRDDDDDGHGFEGSAVEPITAEQREHIEAEIEALGIEREGFLSYLSKRSRRRIDDLADLPASAYGPASSPGTALYAIAAKRRQLAEGVAAAAEAEEARDMA